MKNATDNAPDDDKMIATIAELIAQLIERFPKHADEIRAWAPSYKRALAHWSPRDLDAVTQTVLASWSKGYPPKPATFAAARPRRGFGADGMPDKSAWRGPYGSDVLGRFFHENRRRRAAGLPAFTSPEQLPPDEPPVMTDAERADERRKIDALMADMRKTFANAPPPIGNPRLDHVAAAIARTKEDQEIRRAARERYKVEFEDEQREEREPREPTP
jgi:hypothetical protein